MEKGKVVCLSLRDRFLLNGMVLAEQGDITKMKIVRSISEKLAPSPEEKIKYNIQQSTDRLTWDSKLDPLTEFTFSEIEVEFIKTLLNRLNNESKLTVDHVDVFDIFVNNSTDPVDKIRMRSGLPFSQDQVQ